MPMFEYRCTRCGHEFEELVFGDKNPVCPACHAEATEKLISKPCRHCEAGGLGDFGAPLRMVLVRREEGGPFRASPRVA